MNMKYWLTLLVALSLSGFAYADVLIDDFSTGPVRIDLASGTRTTVQSGSMAGGSRLTSFTIPVNPFRQSNSFRIRGGYLVNSMGFGTGFLTGVVYGKDNPLNLNLLSDACGDIPCGRFRVHFKGNDLSLNTNIKLGSNGAFVGQAGYNIPQRLGPFVWDFPFADFATWGVPLSTVFADIDTIELQFQPDSPIGGNDFAIIKIEVVP